MVTAPPSPSFTSRPGGCSRHNEMAPDDSRALFGAPWKLIVIGAPKVGKSSLVYKFACAEGSPDAKRREQVEYSTTIPTSGDQMLNLQIFCQPPNSSIDDLDDAFFDSAHGAMFVFSTNDSQSLSALSDWYTTVRDRCGDIPTVWCENKIDLIEETKHDHSKVEELTKMYKLRLYRTSVVENYNIVDAFTYLLQKAKAKYPDPSVKPLTVERESQSIDIHMAPTVRRTNGRKPVFNRHGKCTVM